MSGPTQTCELCGLVQPVVPDGRGFPPDIAKNKLRRRCKANGCPSRPRYMAGIGPGLASLPAVPAAPREDGTDG